MNGKVLRVFNTDVNGKEDEREVLMFAMFNHKKYMNKYAIFTIKNSKETNKLYYGSIFLKENTVVIFNIKEELKSVILEFIEEYTKNNFQEFELLDSSKYEKIELVNYNEMEYKDINTLYHLSFPQVEEKKEVKKKKSPLSTIMTLLIIIAIPVIIYFYIQNENNKKTILKCNLSSYSYEVNLDYEIDKIITFDKKKMIESINVTETYMFPSQEEYYNFKNENKHYEYFDIKGSYKYIDEERILKIFYEETTVARNYEQIKSILEKEKYICKEENNE